MSKIEKIEKLLSLFDLYNELLTDIQKNIFIWYYQDDLSLAEISKQTNTSRSSVSDNLKKTEEKLLKFEEKIKLSNRNKKISKILSEYNDENLKKKIEKLL